MTNGNLVWWHNQFRSIEEAAQLGYSPGGSPSPSPAVTGEFTMPSFGDIVLGGVSDVINWGVGQLPARRPPALPPARVPPSLPPAGVPYPGRIPPIPSRGGRMGPTLSRAAVLAAGGYQIGRWLYDAAGNLLGQTPRRRMNVLNPRALRRSMRRVEGFARFAKRTISFTRRVKMKKRRRR